MQITDIVFKLIGSVDGTGCSHTDIKRLGNMRMLTELAYELTGKIDEVRRNSVNSNEYSVRAIGIEAEKFMIEKYECRAENERLREKLSDAIELLKETHRDPAKYDLCFDKRDIEELERK